LGFLLKDRNYNCQGIGGHEHGPVGAGISSQYSSEFVFDHTPVTIDAMPKKEEAINKPPVGIFCGFVYTDLVRTVS
jgi:hypothetical protein